MALYLPDTQTLITHIPKTGGCWIEVALQDANVRFVRAHPPGPDRHWQWTPYDLRSLNANQIVAFVRHPVTWYESYWKWRNTPGKERVYWPWPPRPNAVGVPFERWIQKMMDQEPSYVTRLYEQYLGMEGNPIATHIGRFESLKDDLIRLLSTCGVSLDSSQEKAIRGKPRYNVSRSRVGDPVWPDGVQERLLNMEAPIIRRFYDA